MAMPQVHFAVGMGTALVLGAPVLLLLRRRWLVWLPVVMSVCGGLALVPGLLSRAGKVPAPFSWLDQHPTLQSRAAADAAFLGVAAMYLAAACGYAVCIRWGLRRLPEAEEAFARLRRGAASIRAAAVLVGVVPLLAAGGAAAWLVGTARPPGAAEARQDEEQRAWALLVARRMGLLPGERLGLVHRTWKSDGRWLCGDLGADAPAAGIEELAAQAKGHGCDFLAALAGGEQLSAEGLAAYAAGLKAAREKHPDLAILSGTAWDASAGAATGAGERGALVLLPPQAGEGRLLAEFARRFDRSVAGVGAAPADEALEWLKAHGQSPRAAPLVLAGAPAIEGAGWGQLFSWRRTNELFIGLLGLAGSERVSAREARSQWNPRVARVGGTWDQLLHRGFRLWGAAAASGLPGPDPARRFGPGEFARTHVWCAGCAAEDVLDGLRGGCFWADEGGLVRALDLAVVASGLERPAHMGEVARVAPGDAVAVELSLDIPPTDFAGRPSQVDEVELVSNLGGEPSVVRRFRNLSGTQRLEHVLPPAADNNGGVGFYVRAVGWRRLDDGARLCFYTNPVRVLVRAGAVAPRAPGAEPLRVVSPREKAEPPPPKPKTALPVRPVEPDTAPALAAIGLPASARARHIQTFQKPPAQHWRGAHTSYIGDRGPAMGDDDGRIEFLHRVPVGEGARLFFRCFATACSRLTIVVRTAAGAAAYQAARELPERQWVELDLAFGEDFLPARGTGAPLRVPAEVEAIEWAATRLGPLARFHVTDFVVYEPTAASRRELASRRAGELDVALREAAGRGAPAAVRQRAEAALDRLEAWRARLEPERGPLDAETLQGAERELAELPARLVRPLRWQSAMARAFALAEPAFAVTFAPATQRISSRNAAFAPGPQLATSWDLAAAAGEAESFQVVVLALWDKLEAVEVTASEFAPVDGQGPALPASALSAALVGEVEVPPRADLAPGQTGWVPDPLMPHEAFDVEPGALRCVLFTVRVPPDLLPGEYRGHVEVSPSGLPPVRLPVRLRRWDFALQEHRFCVVGPLDERAIRRQWEERAPGPSSAQDARRALYRLLLEHRVDPVPLLGGDEASDLDELRFCFERGMELAVLHEAASPAPGPRDAGVERAARLAAKVWEAGWGRRAALLLPLVAAEEGSRARMGVFTRTLAREHPALLVIAGGEGDPPGDLVTTYWRRPLGLDPPRRPHDDDVEVRLSRTARREAWELMAASPASPLPNLLLASPLVHARLLPWLAWQHGVRALVLRGVTQWGEGDVAALVGAGMGEGVLVYPGKQSHPQGAEGRGEGVAAAWAPCASLRLVALRDGVEDNECLWLLWDRARQLRERAAERHAALLPPAERLLAEAAGGIGTLERPCREAQTLASLRARVARQVERLDAAWWAEVDAAPDLPAPPAELSAKASDGQVTLAWPRSDDPKAAAYDLFRSRDPRIGFVRLNPTPIESLSYVDRQAENNATYYYFVRARREEGTNGRRSQVATATPRPAPRVVWQPMAGLAAGAAGPYHVALRLEGPGTGGLLPLVRPQIDYALSDAAFDGFEGMTRREGGTWTFDVPDLGWRRSAGKKLRIQVRLVDRQGRVIVPPVEREEPIGAGALPP